MMDSEYRFISLRALWVFLGSFCVLGNSLHAQKGSLLYWAGQTRGTVSLQGKGKIQGKSDGSVEWRWKYSLGELPFPVELYGSSGLSYTSNLNVSTPVLFNSLNLPKGSTTPFGLSWEYLGLAIPFYHRKSRVDLRPNLWKLGMEWHFLEYSLNQGANPSLENVDSSISAFTLQPEWYGKLSKPGWGWFIKPKGVWMQDLGGSPATHLEGELGLSKNRIRFGFKRKKTRIFPANRVALAGQTPSDFIFIRDGWFVNYSMNF